MQIDRGLDTILCCWEIKRTKLRLGHFFKWSEKLITHLHLYRNEADSYKARLKRTEQLLEESRTEFLGISDAKSQLDREVNLLKLTQTKPLQIPTG